MPDQDPSSETAEFGLGRSVPRREDLRFLTGQGRYVADIDVAGQVHMAVVRSNHAHAELRAVDISAAADMEGVLGVHTHADLAADGIGTLPCHAIGPHISYSVVPPRPVLAGGRLRYVGEVVAMVIAETPAQALAAAEMVAVDAEPLETVVDMTAARDASAPQLWPEAPGNVAFRAERGDAAATAAAFDTAAHVIELAVENNRVHACPIETRAGIASYNPATETFDLICNVQGVHGARDELADDVFAIDRERLRISAPDVGGGFGLKNFVYPEWALLLWAAWRHGRPVKWVAARGEDFIGAAHGRDSRVKARLALDADGNFLALDGEITGNMGAYLSGGGPGVASRAFMTAIGGIYRIPAVHFRAVGVFTNTQCVDAYRGAGKPEANFITERLIEVAARRLGFDPVELRLRNAIDSFPYETALGQSIDCGRMRANIEDAVRHADRTGFAERRAATERTGKLRGLGFACFLETSRGAVEEGAEVRFAADGKVEIALGTESQGQGHETAFTQVAVDRLGLAPEDIRYVQADTAKTRMGLGHGGARSMYMGGSALSGAIDAALAKAMPLAAELLQTTPKDVTLKAGRFLAGSNSQSVALIEVARAARDRDDAGKGIDSFFHVKDAPFTFPNGCHAAEVTVDPETGTVELLRYTVCDDYGNLINPRLTEGQVVGGIVQGIGQALGEHIVHDGDSGQLLTGSLMDYLVPRAGMMPVFQVHLQGVPTTVNPLGVKGSGQAGAIAGAQTVVNAVLDALAPLGIDHLDMPLTAEKIWRAIAVARQDMRA